MAGAVLCGPCNAHFVAGAGLLWMLKCRVGGQWQVQDFVGPKCRFRGRRRTLCAELVAGAGLCGPWSADFVAGAGLFDVWKLVAGAGLCGPWSADLVAGARLCGP